MAGDPGMAEARIHQPGRGILGRGTRGRPKLTLLRNPSATLQPAAYPTSVAPTRVLTGSPGVRLAPRPSTPKIMEPDARSMAAIENIDCMAFSLSLETGIRAVLAWETELEDESLQALPSFLLGEDFND
jgi:hypothetical protein